MKQKIPRYPKKKSKGTTHYYFTPDKSVVCIDTLNVRIFIGRGEKSRGVQVLLLKPQSGYDSRPDSVLRVNDLTSV